MVSVALRAVPQPQFFEEEVLLPFEGEGHSLHLAVPFLNPLPSDIARYLLNEFTKPEELVLDPFCGSGTVLLEAALAGRQAIGADLDPLAVQITRSKLRPADLSRVAFGLQGLDLSLPVDVSVYEEHFEPFFDLATFREIFHFRNNLLRKRDFVSEFMQLLLHSVLHGHSATHLSVYTFPHLALPPDEQRALNYRRSQMPRHRSVQPRVLKKAAQVLRDGLPSRITTKSKDVPCVSRADARDLSHLGTAVVDHLITALPEPGCREDKASSQWLRCWLSGIPRKTREHLSEERSSEEWLNFMNESLFEAARVVRRGGRAVLVMKSAKRRPLMNELMAMVEQQLGGFWFVESLSHLQREDRAPKASRKKPAGFLALTLRRL